MSTSELAVADVEAKPRLLSERFIQLGSGLLRLADGGFRKPVQVRYSVRCLGPIAHWKVVMSFDLSELPAGEEHLLFFYPLHPEASITSLELAQSKAIKLEYRVCTDEEAFESAERIRASDSLLELFAGESQPVFSLNLGAYLEQYSKDEPLEVHLGFESWLQTEDGRICIEIPGRVYESLGAVGQTKLAASVYIDDPDELVDEPSTSLAFEREREGDIMRLKIGDAILEDDVFISFRPGRTEMPVTRLRRNSEHFLFSIYPPTSIPASPQRRDLVFALDASENVLDGLFETICDDVCKILRELDDNDRFALVTYGRDIDGYKGGEFCEIDSIEEACAWLRGVEPKGRADIAPLLTRIQDLPSQPDRQLCIFLLAAGHVGNEPAILKSLDFDQSDRRYYAVGIGPSAQQAFLRRLALLARGNCEVAPRGRCYRALTRLLGQTRALLAEVVFEEQSDGGSSWEADSLVPLRMNSLTPEGPVHCLGKGSPEALRFRSKDETGVFFAGTVNAVRTDNPALSGVWASLKVRELLDSIQLTTGSKRQQLRAETSSLAKSSAILTEDTVLVVTTESGDKIQLSVLPSRWSGLPEAVAESASEKPSPAFDWRKGLKAREGVFKGTRPGDSGESLGDGVRPGLRRPGEAGRKVIKSGQDGAKPMLERHPPQASPESSIDEPTVEELAPVEPQQALEPQGASTVMASQAPPTVVVVKSPPEPVFAYTVDPFAEAKARLESYHSQTSDLEARWALASLAALPAEVSTTGPDLPRILAQTVGHLEKRGYYSVAVAVLGLMLREYHSPEVLKKLEILLLSWAGSLSDEYLPEAIQIVQSGLRIAPDSEQLRQSFESLRSRWRALAKQQSELAAVVDYRASLGELPKEPVLSKSQLELARIGEKQSTLESSMIALKKDMDEKFIGLSSSIEDTISGSISGLSGSLQESIASSVLEAIKGSELVKASASTSLQLLPEAYPTEAVPALEALGGAGSESMPASEAVLGLESSAVYQPGAKDEVKAEPAPASVPEAGIELETAVSPPSAKDEVKAEPALSSEVGPGLEDAVASEYSAEAEVGPEPVLEVASELEAVASSEASLGGEVEPELKPEVALEQEVLADSRPSAGNKAEAQDSSDSLDLTRDELLELLQAEPKDSAAHLGVKKLLADAKDRINFYRDLARLGKEEVYHSLSLARAYRDGNQTKVAVVHYQKYLRTEKDAEAYLELADAYDELGKSNLSVSARKAAELVAGHQLNWCSICRHFG